MTMRVCQELWIFRESVSAASVGGLREEEKDNHRGAHKYPD